MTCLFSRRILIAKNRKSIAQCSLWFLVFLLCMGSAEAQQSHQTMPSATINTFNSDLQTYLLKEPGNRLKETAPEAFIASGGLHAASGSMTSTSFATTGYGSNGHYINQSSTAINYSNVGCNGAGDTAWVVVLEASSGSVGGNFTRVGSSRYAVDCVSATQPSLPSGGAWLMKVTIAANALSDVQDLRKPRSFKLRGWYDVTDPLYGAVLDGTTDDTTAIQTALDAEVKSTASPVAPTGVSFPNTSPYNNLTGLGAVGKIVFIPAGAAKITQTLRVAQNTILQGAGWGTSRLLQLANVDLVRLDEGAQLRDMELAGGGQLGYTGRGVVITEGGYNRGYQQIINSRIIQFLNYCIEFTDKWSGAHAYLHNVQAYQLNGTTAGHEAMKLPSTDETGAAGIERKARAFTSMGTRGIDFGKTVAFYLESSRVHSLNFSGSPANVFITDNKLGALTGGYTIKGLAIHLVNNNISEQVTLDTDATYVKVYGNDSDIAYPVIDNSTQPNTNYVIAPHSNYAVPWKGDTADPAIGNGTLTSYYTRNGYTVTWNIFLSINATTTLGTGSWYFTPPIPAIPNAGSTLSAMGSMLIKDISGTTYYVGVCNLFPGNPGKLYCYANNTAGPLSATIPIAWATGDTVKITITYSAHSS